MTEKQETTGGQSLAPAESAADRFAAALDSCAAGADVDLDAELDILREALAVVASPALVEQVDSTVRSVLAEYAQNLQLMGELHARETLGNASRTWRIDAAIDAAIVPFDDAELAVARVELEALESEQRTLIARLNDAVESADLDAVMALRGGALVQIPRQIANALERVLELEAKRAEAGTRRSSARMALATTELAAADAEVTDLRRRLQVAEERHVAAKRRRYRDGGSSQDARERLSTARAALREHRAVAHDAERQQVRRLAGLPLDQPVAVDAEAAQLRYEATSWAGATDHA